MLKNSFNTREGWLLLGDISNFLKVTESFDDMERANYLDEFFNKVIRIVGDNRGELIKFIGDAFLAVFENESNLENVIIDVEKEYSMKWRRSQGSFVDGTFGNSEFSFRDVFGETVNSLFLR